MRPASGTPAIPADALLDGYAIPSGALTVERTARRAITPTIDRREQIAYTGPAREVNPTRRAWRLSWSNLAEHAPRVDRLLARPGPHDLATWQNEALVYAGDGGTSSWVLPWRHAVDVLVAPAGIDPAHFDPEVRLTATGAPLPMLRKTTAEFDGGTPAAGAVWFEVVATAGEPVRWKLASAPAEGAYLWVDVVPVFGVLLDPAAESRQHSGPLAHPRAVTLVET